ncbi:hypothetical protein DJ531_10635 [Sulfolobus sp. A20-N-F6]|nr:hypothetical protein DJ523_03905 [Sulfolobus sp. E5]TRM81664.1 hypothetical protein DJ531_10635 [Sulfolobus sp. A20-N-F6]TRM82373.1 hypothetical protein DJ524_00840 [Sulfolobus sp. D5]TRM89332.1 hypothetical protein DJ521_00095 [Sulfolobus sp. E3]
MRVSQPPFLLTYLVGRSNNNTTARVMITTYNTKPSDGNELVVYDNELKLIEELTYSAISFPPSSMYTVSGQGR